MTALVRSELLKVRTTRGWWAYLIVIVLLVGIGTAAEVGSRSESERTGLDFQFALVDLVGIASLLAIILGITIVTTEFRHGTITPTLLATPGRERVLAGKAIAGVLVALVLRRAGVRRRRRGRVDVGLGRRRRPAARRTATCSSGPARPSSASSSGC